jgi:GNAT superfamily N-acetyltransferase
MLRPLFELAEDSTSQLDAYLGRATVLVAAVGDEVIGHLQLVDTDEPAHAELKNMAVVPAFQRRGIGRQLVQAAIAQAIADGRSTIRVATAAADCGNLRFYQHQGFRLRSVDRDAFSPATGYPVDVVIDGVVLRDRVWLDIAVGP